MNNRGIKKIEDLNISDIVSGGREIQLETTFAKLREKIKTRSLTYAGFGLNPIDVPFFAESYKIKTVLRDLGVNFMEDISIDRGQRIPKLSDISANYYDEEAELVNSEGIFVAQDPQPKRVQVGLKVSNRLDLQSPAFQAIIFDELSGSIATAAEKMLIDYLVADGDINTIADGFTQAKINDMEEAVAIVNENQSALGYIANPNNRKLIKSLESTGGKLLFDKGFLNSELLKFTSNCPEDTLIYGDWKQAFLYEFDKVWIMKDPYTFAKEGYYFLTIIGFWSAQYADAKSFAMISDITA